MTCYDAIPVPALSGWPVYDGVQVGQIDDGDGQPQLLVAAGHHPDVVALAAFRRYASDRLDWKADPNLQPDDPGDGLRVRQSWAVLVPGLPVLAQVVAQVQVDVGPLAAGSFPVTVLEPDPAIPQPDPDPEETS